VYSMTNLIGLISVINETKEIAEEALAKITAFAKMDGAVKEALLAGKSVSEAYAMKAKWQEKIRNVK